MKILIFTVFEHIKSASPRSLGILRNLKCQPFVLYRARPPENRHLAHLADSTHNGHILNFADVYLKFDAKTVKITKCAHINKYSTCHLWTHQQKIGSISHWKTIQTLFPKRHFCMGEMRFAAVNRGKNNLKIDLTSLIFKIGP
jgi:hypothetical protein